MEDKVNTDPERSLPIEKRRQRVILGAREVFLEKGIDNAKIAEIADRAKVGVASVYRYFSTKTDLLLEVAVDYWRSEMEYTSEPLLYEISKLNLTGCEKVEKILKIFQRLYKEHPDFFRFLEMFDNHVIKEGIPPEKLEFYEMNIINSKPLLYEAIEQGKEDGSIRKELDTVKFYMTITHSLMSLSQKLLIRGHIITSDRTVDGLEQINLLVDMAVKYIKS